MHQTLGYILCTRCLNKVYERPLFPGLYLTIVYNYKTIAVPNNSLNPAHPIAVAQAKLQPKDQM